MTGMRGCVGRANTLYLNVNVNLIQPEFLCFISGCFLLNKKDLNHTYNVAKII